MRDCDFEFIRTLVYQRSRISLDASKRALVDARVAKRLRAHRIHDVGEYCSLLQEPSQEEERACLIDAISTNHTYFFREMRHFDFLRETIIPEMVERARKEVWPRLHALSAGCSSGEEPYSLAMTLSESLANTHWKWRVEAADISRQMLVRAAAGIYPQTAVNGHLPVWAKGYFQRGIGPQEGKCRVRPALMASVGFRQLNLLEGPLPYPEPFQVIFCRNVMIYFDRKTQAELTQRLIRLLVPGGYLLTGLSESFASFDHLPIELVRPSIYRKARK